MSPSQRVTVVEDAEQADAATFFLDKTAQTMTVTVNPTLADAAAREGYRVRGAILLALNGLGKYRRAMTEKYGTYKADEKLFEKGEADALFDLEALVAEVRGVPLPEAAPTAKAAKSAAEGEAAKADAPAEAKADGAEEDPEKAGARRKR